MVVESFDWEANRREVVAGELTRALLEATGQRLTAILLRCVEDGIPTDTQVAEWISEPVELAELQQLQRAALVVELLASAVHVAAARELQRRTRV